MMLAVLSFRVVCHFVMNRKIRRLSETVCAQQNDPNRSLRLKKNSELQRFQCHHSFSASSAVCQSSDRCVRAENTRGTLSVPHAGIKSTAVIQSSDAAYAAHRIDVRVICIVVLETLLPVWKPCLH